MASEGYILVASAKPMYFAMAADAARAIRFFDRDRPICLACDDPGRIDAADRPLFEDVVLLENADTRRGTEHHLYLNRISPYDRTLYVDADCLVANEKIHAIWSMMADRAIAFPGRRLTEGKWRVDIPTMCQQLGIDYVVQLNGGVFFFDRSEAAQRFFRTAQTLFEERGREISVRHNTGKGIANEPIWGATHALVGMAEFPLREQLNVSTLRTERWEITPKPSIRLWKDGNVYEPVIVHFLGLGGPKCPNDLYAAFLDVARTGTLPAEAFGAPGPHVPTAAAAG